MDLDLDLDDSEVQAPAKEKISRFQPKASKFKPKPKLSSEPKHSSSNAPFFVRQEPKPSSSNGPVFVKEERIQPQSPPVDDAYEQPSISKKAEEHTEVKMEGEDEEVAVPMEEDDEDRVIREIDVFFTRNIEENTQMYILQYPLRPCWRPYELDERCKKVRLKPLSSEIELELSVDTESSNYDTEARGVRMTKQILSSSWKPPSLAGYAVGVLIDNKLHLNPVHAVVQLRPSMQHLEASGSSKKINASSASCVPVKLEGHESSVLSKKQDKSKEIQSEDMITTENWIPLSYHGPGSDVSARCLAEMVAKDDCSPIQFSMNPGDYINSLCPGSAYKSHFQAPSKRLLSTPLEERIVMWLREGLPAYRFSALKHLAPEESDELVLGVLKQNAVLVQGLWVPKSKLVFEGGKGKEAFARDYVLLLFSKNPIVKYSQVNNPRLGQLNKYMKETLKSLAVERSACMDWKFKEPTDVSFIKSFPNIIKEQEELWEGVEKQISNAVHGGRNMQPLKTSLRPSTSDKAGTSSNNIKAPPMSTLSVETREALSKALQKLFQVHRVCSFKLICQGLRDVAVSQSTLPKADPRPAITAAHAVVDAPEEELQTILSQVAVKIHGVYVLKSSPEHPEYNPFRNVLISLFRAKGINAKFKRADIVEAAKIALKREISNNEYIKVLSELCVSKNSIWSLKSGDGNSK